MNIIRQLLKSKTVDTNVLAGALVTILTACGVTVPVSAITSFFVLANIILRAITKEPLSAK